jgi:hypothetical protein
MRMGCCMYKDFSFFSCLCVVTSSSFVSNMRLLNATVPLLRGLNPAHVLWCETTSVLISRREAIASTKPDCRRTTQTGSGDGVRCRHIPQLHAGPASYPRSASFDPVYALSLPLRPFIKALRPSPKLVRLFPPSSSSESSARSPKLFASTS